MLCERDEPTIYCSYAAPFLSNETAGSARVITASAGRVYRYCV